MFFLSNGIKCLLTPLKCLFADLDAASKNSEAHIVEKQNKIITQIFNKQKQKNILSMQKDSIFFKLHCQCLHHPQEQLFDIIKALKATR